MVDTKLLKQVILKDVKGLGGSLQELFTIIPLVIGALLYMFYIPYLVPLMGVILYNLLIVEQNILLTQDDLNGKNFMLIYLICLLLWWVIHAYTYYIYLKYHQAQQTYLQEPDEYD